MNTQNMNNTAGDKDNKLPDGSFGLKYDHKYKIAF